MKIRERAEKNTDLDVLNQVLTIFLTIDKKILELHQCSSDDFLSLNKTLKQNYQKANYITENVNIAFDKIGRQGNLKNLEAIKGRFFELQHEIKAFEVEINNNLDILELIMANFSLMFVPINNFRQNLASLKLLLSNIKLTNNLYDRCLKNFSETESSRIEAVINKVKESCPVFEENIYVILKHVKTLYQDIGNLKELLFNDILNKLELLKDDFETIEKHNLETQAQRINIEKIAQNCKSSVGSIITNLQYHDIIRQKMEHIQQTHKLIIGQINDSSGNLNIPGNAKTNPFFLQIPQIIEIQTAQLLHTNKDYQNSINHISKKMIEIGQDMTALARIYKGMSVFEHKGRSVSRERMSKMFEKIIADNKTSLNKYKELTNDVALIQRIVNDLFDKFRDLEMIENSIEQSIIDKISFAKLLVSEEQETASQAQQILKLYADNHFEKNKIRTLFNNTIGQLNSYIRSNAQYTSERKGTSQIELHLGVAEANFWELVSNLVFLEEIQQEVMDKSKEIEHDSKQVVANVKYYDFFEQAIDDIVGKFDNINNLLRDKGMAFTDIEQQQKGLRQIEKYYTMKSERIIHNQSLKKSGNTQSLWQMAIDTEDLRPNMEGNDVEFF